ncbi:MAG: 2-amino-4-hydroxy-6-hydroxymethyldihydropteridine diphosphokinase [Candidatus Latescibacterota bacterium]|jgi:2-amino-4-hydroxy-6-hydroxymethyldihydropteridine diphosphokinase
MSDLSYIALGSNLGDRLHHLQSGLNSLQLLSHVELIAVSSAYETEPQGYIEQPTFLNAVCSVRSTFSAPELLSSMQEIENNHQRQRHIHWGPRTLDLDLLLYGDQRFDSDSLIVPHPHMTERSFVLVPLCQIAPQLRNPLNNRLYTDDLRLLEGPNPQAIAELTTPITHVHS